MKERVWFSRKNWEVIENIIEEENNPSQEKEVAENGPVLHKL